MFLILAIFQCSNNYLKDRQYIAVFRAYLVTISKALMSTNQLLWSKVKIQGPNFCCLPRLQVKKGEIVYLKNNNNNNNYDLSVRLID